MANPQHISWLKEGAELWNKRRRNERFSPDLRGVDLSAEFDLPKFPTMLTPPDPVLRGIDLSQANLREARLENLDLSQANFRGARLNDAKLNNSSFRNSWFYHTILDGSHLERCDFADARLEGSFLRSADFTDANLSGATFIRCHVEKAIFHRADLSDTDFILTRPWVASLFYSPMQDTDVEGFDTDSINSIDRLLEECRNFRNESGGDQILYFRGESKFGRKLQSFVMRKPRKNHLPLRPVEGEMLKELSTRQPDAFNNLGSALGEWVFAQHHELPTRFLDVTRNPLVALHYACSSNPKKDGQVHVFAVPRSMIKSYDSDAVSVIANFAKLSRWEKNLILGKIEADAKGDEFHRMPPNVREYRLMQRAKTRLYDGIRQEKPYFQERVDIRDLYRVFVVEPQLMFERIQAQSGAFLVSAFHERFERAEVLNWNPDIPIYSHYTLRIPSEEKEPILRDLALLDVTRETLFPSVDESARSVREHYLHRSKRFDEDLTPPW